MIIGIDGSRAFLKRRTGIEEYSYQVIKHLRYELSDVQVVLYIRADQEVDFELPSNWAVKKLWAPRLWTQVRLSLEMLLHRPDVLFVPAHTVPFIHPKKTVVVVHGLEYEFCPKAYSLWARLYMHWSIGFSCMVSSRVICVSRNTKRDVMKVYHVPEKKIDVVYEGYALQDGEQEIPYRTSHKILPSDTATVPVASASQQNLCDVPDSSQSYFLFIGRLEERKNIVRYIEAFGILKEKTGCLHKLVLAGKEGYGYKHVQKAIDESQYKQDIVVLGYIGEEDKWKLLRHTDIFLFATLYEGFGIPVLEAQVSGVPVITSNTSSLPEVAGEGALLVNPESVEEIANALESVVSDKELKNAIIQKGLDNVGRFSWEKCAKEIGVILKSKR